MMNIPLEGRVKLDDNAGCDVKVVLTGDLCPTAAVERRLLKGQGKEVFGDVLAELHDKDLSITNLELALTDGGAPIDKCGPNLKADPAVLPELAKAGFDVYSLANNHTRDFGDEALIETLTHISDTGAYFVGAGRNVGDAARPIKLDVKGLKLAVFSISMHCDCDAGSNSPGVNVLNPARNAVEIMQAVQAGWKVIVIIHDGKEFIPFPSDRICNYCRAFVDAGASAVIGHHPHIIRGLEVYNGGLIAYSLGNFLFPPLDGAPEPEPFWLNGFSVRLHLNRSGLAGFDVIPHLYNPETEALELMHGREQQTFLDSLNRLNQILANGNANESYFASDCENFNHYADSFKNYGEKWLKNSWASDEQKYAAKVFHHYISCDEHWDLLETMSKRQWLGETSCPEDLKDITRGLGRL